MTAEAREQGDGGARGVRGGGRGGMRRADPVVEAG